MDNTSALATVFGLVAYVLLLGIILLWVKCNSLEKEIKWRYELHEDHLKWKEKQLQSEIDRISKR